MTPLLPQPAGTVHSTDDLGLETSYPDLDADNVDTPQESSTVISFRELRW